jgi:aspartate kinase
VKVPIILPQFYLLLKCASVTIWKDVGVMNADPRYFENASLLNQISYREAIELAFMAQRSFTQNTAAASKGNSFVCKIVLNPLLTELVFLKEST